MLTRNGPAVSFLLGGTAHASRVWATLSSAHDIVQGTARSAPRGLITQAGWMARDSYVVKGEAWQTFIDWTQQEEGWSSPGFKPGAAWRPADVQPTTNPAIALGMPLSAVLGEVKPISVSAEPDGGFLYTFPKNFGTPHMHVHCTLHSMPCGALPCHPPMYPICELHPTEANTS